MILETMRDAVRVRLGTPPDETFYYDQYVDDLLNEALQTISVDGQWPWLETTETINTTVGTRFYPPNANWIETKALSIAGFDAMVFLDLQEVRNWPDDVRDVPMFYTIYMEQIYLAPAPSAIYAIRHDYIRNEAKLTDNTDTPIMPSQFHYAIVAFAVHLAHLRSGDLARAQAALTEYQNWKRRMEESRSRSTSTIKVRVRPGRDL